MDGGVHAQAQAVGQQQRIFGVVLVQIEKGVAILGGDAWIEGVELE